MYGIYYRYAINKFVCLEPAADLLSDARYQEMPDYNILSVIYSDTGILPYFLVDETVGLLIMFFLCSLILEDL